MAALKLTPKLTMQPLLNDKTSSGMAAGMRSWNDLAGRAAALAKSSDTLLMVKVYALILISIVFTHDDRMKHVQSVIIKAARAKTKQNFCHAPTPERGQLLGTKLQPGQAADVHQEYMTEGGRHTHKHTRAGIETHTHQS